MRNKLRRKYLYTLVSPNVRHTEHHSPLKQYKNFKFNFLITDRIQRMREGNIFSLCVIPHPGGLPQPGPCTGGGYPSWVQMGGTLARSMSRWGYPIQVPPVWTWDGVPLPHLDLGWGTPCPCLNLGWGTPHLELGWGTPCLNLDLG